MKTKKPEPGSKEFLEQVRNVLRLSESDGHLVWNASGIRAGMDGDFANCQILISGRRHPPEKIAWLLYTWNWPTGKIGFKNGIQIDFRADNLFEVVTDKQLTITQSGNLFVVSNGSEQVLTTEFLDQAVQMVRSILEG